MFSQNDPKPNNNFKVIVSPDDITLNVGETQQFSAYLEYKDGSQGEADFTWSLTGKDIGSVSDDGLFTALEAGHIQVVASFEKKSGKAKVTVVDTSQGKGKKGLRVVMEPHSVTLAVGDSIQFNAYVTDSTGASIDTILTWRIDDESVGEIDQTGLLLAMGKGNTFVYAEVGDLSGKAHVKVQSDAKNRNRWRQILIVPNEPIVAVGDSIQFTATLLDTNNAPIDTVFSWTLSNPDCGTISDIGLFTAMDKGNSFVYATLGDLSGRARVVVQDSTHWDNRKDGELTIQPSDTIIMVGDVVHFRSVFIFNTGEMADTTVEWSTHGRRVGDITDEGVFTAASLGTGLVRAKFHRYLAMTRIMVVDAADTSAAETDTVQVVFEGNEGGEVSDTTGVEGQTTFTFNNLPWPMSMLNGGQVIFPPGSLSEDISIRVTMPNFAIYENDSTVSYGDLILNGVSFHVYVGDSLASPYHFSPPANLVLPYDSTLMDELGIVPEDIWMFFYTEQNGLDTTGIFNVIIDDINCKIYAEVSHFSTLAIAAKTSLGLTGIKESDGAAPLVYRLYENFPNPFNPETIIRFDLAGYQEQPIRLGIYNILGQEVRTLIQGVYPPGQYQFVWDGKNQNGQSLGSGIYIYRLKGNDFTKTRRMIMLR